MSLDNGGNERGGVAVSSVDDWELDEQDVLFVPPTGNTAAADATNGCWPTNVG